MTAKTIYICNTKDVSIRSVEVIASGLDYYVSVSHPHTIQKLEYFEHLASDAELARETLSNEITSRYSRALERLIKLSTIVSTDADVEIKLYPESAE